MPQNQARASSNLASPASFLGPDGPRIIFVSGKGGVGKSLFSATLAREQALLGKKVLLAEIGDSSYFKDFWQLEKVTYHPQALEQGFDLALWSGETSLREYVLHYLKLERLYGLFFENKAMRSLINVAPGLSEIAILGKITSGIRNVGPQLKYDLIVVDCYSTGHALSLLRAPRGMMSAIQFGPMGHHSREIEAVLMDPRLVAYVTVTLLEEMPVIESIEFCKQLQADFKIQPILIANKVFKTDLSSAEVSQVKEHGPRDLREFAAYVSGICERQADFLKQLKEAGFAAVCELPLIFSNDPKVLLAEAGEALRAH